jgi:folate-binding protein YgfZ
VSGRADVRRIERPDVARVALRGPDARDFLNRIASNETASLAAGEGCAALLLERTGRFVDRLIVCEADDHRLLVGSPGRGEAVREFLEKYVIADDVRVESLATTHRLFTVAGTDAAQALGVALGLGFGLGELPRFHHRPVGAPGDAAAESRVIRAEDVGGPAFHVVLPAAGAAALAAALGAIPEMDAAEWRARRIAAGLPEFGDEYGDRTVSLETRMFDAISLTKGCFVGQEVVARLHNFKRVKRGLVHLLVDGGEVPERDAPLLGAGGGEELGRVVSAARTQDGVFALGYVAAGHLAPGTALAVAEGDRRRGARILPLALAGETT